MRPAVLLLGGPTATGKTECAAALAQELGAEVVSADARQIYRHLDIGTAKPTAALRARVPHHLLDIREPGEGYSAADFARDAAAAIAAILDRGKRPLVVGGTGLYFRALTEGLFPAAKIAPEIRQRVEALFAEQGRDGLEAYLAGHDRKILAALDRRNPARLKRAVEYHLQTGRSLGEDRAAAGPAPGAFRWLRFALELPRPELHARIAARIERMLASGWLAEVEALAGRFDFAASAFDAVGYRELQEVVNQQLSLEEAKAVIGARTRQYARRQITWFRHQGRWSHVRAESGVTAKIASAFAEFAENKSA